MVSDALIQVAVDGAGKNVRNVSRYALVDVGDGLGPVQKLVYTQVVTLADAEGGLVDTESLWLPTPNRAILRMLAKIKTALTTSAPPTLQATVGLPPPTLPLVAVDAMGDRFGRQVVVPVTVRELVGTQTTTISASTAETAIVTGIGGVFCDLVMLIISNTSAATSTRIDVRDATAGTVLFSLQSVGGAAPIGFALPVPIPQTTLGATWTAQCATSTTDIRIYAVFAKQK